jgi:hypothetical protein
VIERSLNPLWQESIAGAMSVRELTCERCAVHVARSLNAAWHSRLPRTQTGPWQFAFAPHCTASWMLARMIRWFRANAPERERAISYQDCSVHSGTIYKAAGWDVGLVAKPRQRDRSAPRRGTRRDYRNDQNGADPAGSAKVRWEISLA